MDIDQSSVFQETAQHVKNVLKFDWNKGHHRRRLAEVNSGKPNWACGDEKY